MDRNSVAQVEERKGYVVNMVMHVSVLSNIRDLNITYNTTCI